MASLGVSSVSCRIDNEEAGGTTPRLFSRKKCLVRRGIDPAALCEPRCLDQAVYIYQQQVRRGQVNLGADTDSRGAALPAVSWAV